MGSRRTSNANSTVSGSDAGMRCRGTKRAGERGEWLENWLKLLKRNGRQMAGFGKTQKHKKSSKRDANRSRAEEAIKKSITEYQQGNLESAKIRLDKLLESDHSNSFALGFLATIEKALGNNERALKLFKRSTDISQDNSDILHNYSILLIEKDPEKALGLSNKATNNSPDNSRYLERNGYLKWQVGDLDNALEATLKAIRLTPNLIDAHLNLGGIYKDLGNLDQALAATLKSLELEPENPDALMNLGSIYKELGNLDQALAFTHKSLEFKPDNTEAISNLFNMHEEGYLPTLRSTAFRAVKNNREILNDSDFVEIISSLGKDFTKEIISASTSSNK